MNTKTQITPERAMEIWKTKGPFGQFNPTPEENEAINEVWSKMNPSASWVSALLEIANSKEN